MNITPDRLAADAKIVGVTPEVLAERIRKYKSAAQLDTGVFRPYPDAAARAGYVIVRANAAMPAVGQLIRYGTGGVYHGMVGTVIHIGDAYEVEEDIGVIDEDHGDHSGFRRTGRRTVAVRRVYFRR